jgi:hypothetical protein
MEASAQPLPAGRGTGAQATSAPPPPRSPCCRSRWKRPARRLIVATNTPRQARTTPSKQPGVTSSPSAARARAAAVAAGSSSGGARGGGGAGAGGASVAGFGAPSGQQAGLGAHTRAPTRAE